MSGKVTFTFDPGGSGENAVELNGPTSPTEVSQWPQHVTDRTVDGTRFTYKKNDVVLNDWNMNFNSITTAQKTAFDQWFRDVVEGPTNPFTYTHTDGEDYTNCRLIENSLQWRRIDNQTWELTLRIEVPSEVNS